MAIAHHVLHLARGLNVVGANPRPYALALAKQSARGRDFRPAIEPPGRHDRGESLALAYYSQGFYGYHAARSRC